MYLRDILEQLRNAVGQSEVANTTDALKRIPVCKAKKKIIRQLNGTKVQLI